MQVQAPPTFAPYGAPADPGGGVHSGSLFNAFYEATAPIAFDFVSGLSARPDEAASIVAASYEDIWHAHEQAGASYHVVPLLADVYARALSSHRPAVPATRPGADAVNALAEPHRSVLHLTERHRFSPEDAGHILGLGPEEVKRDHDDARMVVHGVSAALALCPGGSPACPQLAATLDPRAAIVDQIEVVLGHAERCAYCTEVALASPDPIRELRYGEAGVGYRVRALGAAPSATNGQVNPGLVGPPVVGAAAAGAVWSAAPGAVSPLPGPAPLLVSKADEQHKAWGAPKRLWKQATGWQKSGAIVAVLLIVALLIAVAAGGDSEDVAARTNSNGAATTPQGSVSTKPPPMATIPPTTTTGPVTTTVEQTPYTSPPSTQPYTPSPGGSSSDNGSSATPPATTEPPPTTTTAPPPPPPVIQSAVWGQFPFKDPNTGRYSLPFTWTSTATSSSWTTTWGAAGSVQSGNSIQLFSGVPSGTQTISLSVTDANGTTTQEFPVTLP